MRPELGKLQAYSKDDLELFISDLGEIYAAQSAIARMMNMQQGHLSSVLKRPLEGETEPEAFYQVKLPSAKGTREQTLYGVGTICKLAMRYNKQLAAKFTDMGAKACLYQLAGYQMEFKDRAPVVSDIQDSVNVMIQAREALDKLINLHTYTEDKAGLNAFIKLNEQPRGNIMTGRMTIRQMAAHLGVELTRQQAQSLGRSMSGVARSHEAMAPCYVRENYKDKKGNYQAYNVLEFDARSLPLFHSLCIDLGVEGVPPLTNVDELQ